MNAIATSPLQARTAAPTHRVKRMLKAATLIGTVVMLAAMASLHVLRPDLNPFSEPMSYYGPGVYGALFTLSVGAFAVGLAALAVLLRLQDKSPVAVTFVGIAAASAFVVAAFNADLPDAPHTLHGIMHGLGALFFWTSFPVATIELSSQLRQTPGALRAGHWSLAMGVLSLFELALSLAIAPLGGLFERTLLLTDAAWAATAAVLREDHCSVGIGLLATERRLGARRVT
jgi:Protein of unknown function (DUF998)